MRYLSCSCDWVLNSNSILEGYLNLGLFFLLLLLCILKVKFWGFEFCFQERRELAIDFCFSLKF